MNKTIIILTILLWATLQYASGQSRWGIEFKLSKVNTSNSGELLGGSYKTVDEESDLVTNSQSLGIIYKLNERNLLKFHIGSHQNGRTLSYTECSDFGGCYSYTDLIAAFRYFQMAPSYCFRILNKKIIIPIEVGININKQRSEEYNIFFDVNKFNFDYELSTGLDYRLDPNLIFGLHGIYTGNINEYQNDETIYGTYEPKQLGVEFSILYEFEKNNQR